MRKCQLAMVAGAAVLLPTAALADAPDYTYLSGDYIVDGEADTDLNAPGAGAGAGSEEDYDGFGLGGSIAITPNVFLKADYLEQEGEDSNDTQELLSAGVGLSGPIETATAPLDGYGTLTYESLESDDSDLEADGFGVTGGLRWMATPVLEINPHIGYIDYGSIDGLPAGAEADLDGWRFGIDGLYSLNEQFALTAGYRTTKLDIDGDVGGTSFSGDLDMENEIRIGARLYFAGT